MTTRRTYRNPEPEEPDHEHAPEGAPEPTHAAKAGSFIKQMAVIAASAVVAVMAVDMYRKYKRPSGGGGEPGEAEVTPNPAPGAMQGMMMPGAPQILPMPIPWPTPGGFGGFPQGPPQIQVPLRNDALDKAQELELAKLRAETAKAEAMTAQMQAFMDEG